MPKGPRTLPERTVDAWVAAYLVSAFPSILLWAPTQRSLPDLDYAAMVGGGKTFVLEDKGAYTKSNSPGEHFVEIHHRQLHNYCCNRSLRDRTFYVLPSPPYPPAALDSAIPPRVAAARIDGHPWGAKGAHKWMYAVPVTDLWKVIFPGESLPSTGPPVPKGSLLPITAHGYTSIACKDFKLSGRKAWPTLEQFASRVRECQYGEDVGETPAYDESPAPSDRAIAAFVPYSDL